MWAILGTIFGHIGSGLVSAFGNSVLAPILNTVQNGQNANRDVAVQSLQADLGQPGARRDRPSLQGTDLLHRPAGGGALRCDLCGQHAVVAAVLRLAHGGRMEGGRAAR
jgi:hypothetical protein